MLKVINAASQLDFGQLMRVHKQSNQEKGALEYPNLTPYEQLMRAEQEIYAYICEILFREKGFYCIWEENGCYLSVLRMEPYKNAWVLTALETCSEVRNCGYGKKLVNSTLEYLMSQDECIVYSHIDKKNKPSLSVHYACKFERVLDYAVLLDGSVTHKMFTLRFAADKK